MKYAYNTRSEVIGAERFFGSDPATATELVAGQNWDYAFDPIGNRLTAARDGDTEIYTANALNQYTQRTIPGSAHVAGTAAEDATVTINRPTISGTTVEPATRQGAYFHKKLALDNSAHADAEEIEVLGVKAGAGTNGIDIVSAYTGFVWAAKTPEMFTYDADGNMLSDALRQYEWDAENRLVGVTVSNLVGTAGPAVRLEFAYDYMSRRVSKTVYEWISGSWSLQQSSRFLYDGWNLISEVCAATGKGTITDDYVWGLDLSGSLQGAGGIGGLLARYRSVHRYYDEQGMMIVCHRPSGNPENKQTLRINESAWPAHLAHGDTLGACDGSSVSNSAFLYTYDGNGNVSELLLSSVVSPPSSVVAHYEYSPFGETIAAVGSEAQDNPFRFSTKYWDDESGLYYYGYRYYSPSLGRWLSRDPIGEEEGLNLFHFTGNNPLNFIDKLGLKFDNKGKIFTRPFYGTGLGVGGQSVCQDLSIDLSCSDDGVCCKIKGELNGAFWYVGTESGTYVRGNFIQIVSGAFASYVDAHEEKHGRDCESVYQDYEPVINDILNDQSYCKPGRYCCENAVLDATIDAKDYMKEAKGKYDELAADLDSREGWRTRQYEYKGSTYREFLSSVRQ